MAYRKNVEACVGLKENKKLHIKRKTFHKGDLFQISIELQNINKKFDMPWISFEQFEKIAELMEEIKKID